MLSQKLIGATVKSDVQFVSSSINRVNASSITVTAPSGIQNGDLLVSFIYANETTRTVTYPSGFSQILQDNATSPSVHIATKVAASESGNYTFTYSTSANMTAGILVYRNATNSSRLVGTVTRAANSATITAASISPTTAGALIGFFGLNRAVTVVTAPSGMTQRALYTLNAPSVGVYDIVPNGTGATGSKSIVWSNASANAGVLMQIHKG